MKIRLNSLTFNCDANLAKVGVASSSLVFRSKIQRIGQNQSSVSFM